MNLKELFDKHGTDKGTKHRYDIVYDHLFSPRRNQELNFLEVGVWKGNGLAAFHEYFPNANLYGIDDFTRVNPEQVPIFKKDRVQWGKCDSTIFEESSLLLRKFGVQFDIIVDDGAHHPHANMFTFMNFKDALKPGGIYVIEDVWPLESMSQQEWSHPWVQKNPSYYNNGVNERFLRELKESGLGIERYDNRLISGQPDSYLIVLHKD